MSVWFWRVVLIGTAALAVFAVWESKHNAERSADRELCRATEGVRGRFLGDVDCWKYDNYGRN